MYICTHSCVEVRALKMLVLAFPLVVSLLHTLDQLATSFPSGSPQGGTEVSAIHQMSPHARIANVLPAESSESSS